MKTTMMTIGLVLMVALTAACATFDYCDVQGPARCELEQQLENPINHQLEGIGSEARVDVAIQCPDGATCPPVTVPTGTESGDWRVLKVPVTP